MNEEPTKFSNHDNNKLDVILAHLGSIDGRLITVEQKLDGVETNLNSIGGRLTTVKQKLDGVETNLNSIGGRLTTLEERVDRRLMETRPIWEAVNQRLDNIESDIRKMHKKVTLFHEDVIEVRVSQRDLENRVDKLEKPLGEPRA